jgi:hypothetical protein
VKAKTVPLAGKVTPLLNAVVAPVAVEFVRVRKSFVPFAMPMTPLGDAAKVP